MRNSVRDMFLYTRLCHLSTFLLIIINHENAIQLRSEAYVAGYISSHYLVLELALDTFILRAVELVVRSVFLLKSKGHRYSSCHPSSRWSGILPKCCQRQSVVTPRYEISFWAHHRTIWTLYVLIIQEFGRQCDWFVEGDSMSCKLHSNQVLTDDVELLELLLANLVEMLVNFSNQCNIAISSYWLHAFTEYEVHCIFVEEFLDLECCNPTLFGVASCPQL